MTTIVSLIFYLIFLAFGCGVVYFVVKAAVAGGIREALRELDVEVALRNAVKKGALEAAAQLEKDKTTETEQKNG